MRRDSEIPPTGELNPLIRAPIFLDAPERRVIQSILCWFISSFN